MTDKQEVIDLVKTTIVDSLRDVVNGGREDLQKFALEIARDSVEAALRQDKEALLLLANQRDILLKKHKLVAATLAPKVVEKVLDVAFALLFNLVTKIPKL